ncbi:probable LRR receptor-like serine/threonine-protein kinase At4g29180 isoform X2 [Zingiber officinale]|uniref:probable LRR receptor-like serine/threonine-protein kinase At4g29180 isoform X2 n=1 Tax=Zingiber officinale TaxID=94328 RepID=UPI001C4C7440|nr:probable LRR receptor-like serine/threonine-protein kinase At4g29180 isoform X2 [Zingiber officinale]
MFVQISVNSSCSLFLSKVLVALNVTRHIEATIAQKTEHGPHLQVDGEKFTFNHLQVITNDFAQVIGKGAFATFYLGHSDELKLQSKCIHDLLHSRPKNLNEARQLLRIHHRNVVSLLGYCRDETFLALVYEYMPHGSLKDHFQGIDQEYGELYYASGLDYLHGGCMPPIIHRDLKTYNILLGEKLEAELTDYGISKSFNNNTDVTASKWLEPQDTLTLSSIKLTSLWRRVTYIASEWSLWS